MQLDTSFILPTNCTNSVVFSDVLLIEDGDLGDDLEGQGEGDMRVVACVLLEMALSFLGILTNLLGENQNKSSSILLQLIYSF